MRLYAQAREYYTLEIDTVPPVTGWEASFDDGATYYDGEFVGGTTYRWLVAGPGVDPGDAVAIITKNTEVMVRAASDPEVIVDEAPMIYLYSNPPG